MVVSLDVLVGHRRSEEIRLGLALAQAPGGGEQSGVF